MPQAPAEDLTFPEVTDIDRSDAAVDGKECSHYYPGINETCKNDADLVAEFDSQTRVPFCESHFSEPEGWDD